MWTSFASAKVDVKKTNPLVLPANVYNSEAAQFSNSVLPKTISQSESSKTVVSKIIDNSLSYIWNNSELKKTSVGQVADKIENQMKADISLGQPGLDSKEHKLSFRVMAAQALAKLEYKGWFKGAIKYDAKNANAEAEVLENLSNNKDLVITHSVNKANENNSQLSLRWNW